jgi:RHS repeat-associated protein
MRDSTGSTDRDTLYVFDRAGQRTRTTTPGGVIDTGWDLAGNLHELTQPDGTQFRYTHLPTGQIDEFSGYSPGAGVYVAIASYGYDDDGIETSEWIYGAGGSSRSHILNAAGKTATFAEAMRKPDTTWENYTSVLGYRADQRLGTEQVNGGTTATMSYDDAGQLTAQSGDDPVSYAYGTRGNRTASSAGSDTTTYTTNPNGSIASTTTGSTVVTYDYDDAGRRTAATTKVSGATTRTVATTYDARGKPATITDTRGSDVITEERSYDGGAQLTDVTITGGDSAGTFEINWDTTAAIPRMSEMRRDGAVWVRLDNANTLLAFDAVWGPVWYKLDARSSVINPDDNYLNAPGPTSYDPFGKRSGAPYFWAGYRSEPHFGDLIHLRNRDYDPTIGQFTSLDPLDGVNGSPTVANSYNYVENDPQNGTDPMGLCRKTDVEFSWSWTDEVGGPHIHTHGRDERNRENFVVIRGPRHGPGFYACRAADESTCKQIGLPDHPGPFTIEESNRADNFICGADTIGNLKGWDEFLAGARDVLSPSNIVGCVSGALEFGTLGAITGSAVAGIGSVPGAVIAGAAGCVAGAAGAGGVPGSPSTID